KTTTSSLERAPAVLQSQVPQPAHSVQELLLFPFCFSFTKKLGRIAADNWPLFSRKFLIPAWLGIDSRLRQLPSLGSRRVLIDIFVGWAIFDGTSPLVIKSRNHNWSTLRR